MKLNKFSQIIWNNLLKVSAIYRKVNFISYTEMYWC